MNFASLFNYYEHLVFDCITEHLVPLYEDQDEEFFLDVACYSLTRLPSRYIRHEIDMAFYLAPENRKKWKNGLLKRLSQPLNSLLKDFSRATLADWVIG